MLLALSEISKIENYLASKIDSKEILDYRISFKFNMDVDVFVCVDKTTSFSVEDFSLQFPNSNNRISLELISLNELRNDDFYQSLFENTGKTSKKVFHLRRRLDNQLGFQEYKRESSTPVVTFYSYKGGVGRTTTLAAFAAHYAMHEERTVVAIDCDFEAPGITNFFGLIPDEMKDGDNKESVAKNGVIEYLLDRQFLGDNCVDLRYYLIEVSSEYSGKGKIYVVPAGNLSASLVTDDPEHRHLDHYLEGLARLNISGTEQILEQFNNLLEHIERELEPDVILIDSRTGFNDIFANIGLSLSSIVIGFFSSNYQTLPGLNGVLSYPSLLKKIILVNSIIPGGKHFEEFKEIIRGISQNANINEEIVQNFDLYKVTRNQLLESLGTLSEYKNDFIELIGSKASPEYVALFTKIIERLDYLQDLEDEGNSSNQQKVDSTENTESEEQVDTVTVNTGISVELPTIAAEVTGSELLDERIQLRHEILEKLKTTFANLFTGYAEQERSENSDQFLKDRFYFRNCMRDLFSKDRFLVLGGKGTGKTLLYKTLSTNPKFLEFSKEMSGEKGDYKVINVISLPLQKDSWEPPEQRKYLELTSFGSDNYTDGDFWFRRFWQVYTWNAIFLSLADLGIELTSSLQSEVQAIENDENTRQRFLKLINADDSIAIIESDLKKVDAELRQKNINLMLTYDQLDKVIKPNLWSKGVAPLISYWWSNPFSKIYPKLFVRRDLFKKLGNLTNKQSLTSVHILNLEWNKEEIFGFLFKLVFAQSKEAFFKLMALYGVPGDTVSKTRSAIDKNNQVILDRKYLEPLVETFCGKFVEISGGYPIPTYDWFHKNLCNADGTISLRPFLDLIAYSIENYFEQTKGRGHYVMNKYPSPILDYRYFTYGGVRKQAVERHFEDLVKEEGNKDLERIFSYIQLHAPANLRKSFLTTNELKILFEKVKETYPETEHASFDDLSNSLIDNGIIERIYKPGGAIVYAFALLYKYYLGLRNK